MGISSDKGSVCGLSTEQTAAYVYVYNRWGSFQFNNVYYFLDYTKEQIEFIKR